MAKPQKREDHLAAAARSRRLAAERQAQHVAELAGQQAKLKREAEERRQRRLGRHKGEGG